MNPCSGVKNSEGELRWCPDAFWKVRTQISYTIIVNIGFYASHLLTGVNLLKGRRRIRLGVWVLKTSIF